ncbi:LON peptidase substrate-binding domain-containing protein [Coralloluteibacterium stylophorae]|uniref:LON peptidase substrate-binding domain-containing protein n=1 Tax=Coralloluteibacterium stylophorae TaxID=1776034 RepID=A0A8J7VSY3_9GAMM|nr:LON peptidase substrate-binding domain-containing protein [Coralloluteibacterium stylophorae]MBS7458533.1 LON peptidase substrate-binding domain-containing protein [Coralloluteibacterium stylophorae]
MACDTLPLFPLNAVLFPGGELGLRIFETRYLDMVRECTRNDHGFGVCLILTGQETGAPAMPAAVGTEARIVDFATTDDGLLAITAQGGRRFRVRRTRVRDSGLVLGDIDWCATDTGPALLPQHGLLSTLLSRLLDVVDSPHARAANLRLDDAAWVGWRLAELLPLSDAQRQRLLQDEDPHARLDRLVEVLPQFQEE